MSNVSVTSLPAQLKYLTVPPKSTSKLTTVTQELCVGAGVIVGITVATGVGVEVGKGVDVGLGVAVTPPIGVGVGVDTGNNAPPPFS